MSIFDRFERDMERREFRREMAWQENMIELELEEEFLFDGMFFDPYTHGDVLFDPVLGHHGIFFQGRWHPMDFQNGTWSFVHPRLFNVPRNYQPQNPQPAQVPGFGGGYGGNSYNQGGCGPRNAFGGQGGYAPQGAFGQAGGYAPQGAFGQQGGDPPPSAFTQQGAFGPEPAAPPAGAVVCARCQATHPAGTRFCPSCGNDLSAAPTPVPCASCNAPLGLTQRFCANCGTPRPT